MFHHPAFQSLALPLLLAVLAMALLRIGPGARLAAWGALLGLLGALAWMPGFDWPAAARTQRLPWLVLASLGLVGLAAARGRSARLVLPLAVLGWAMAAAWLAAGQAGQAGWAAWAGVSGVGAVVLALLARAGGADGAAAPGDGCRGDGAVGAAVLGVAALGLAVLAATGGSLLLAQLALMLVSSVAAAAGWAWLRPASRIVVTPALMLAFGLAWLSIAWCWLLAAPAGFGSSAARLGVLALAFLVPTLLGWLRPSFLALRWQPVAAVVLAALPLVLAAVWLAGDGAVPMPDTAVDKDDPYLTPSWR